MNQASASPSGFRFELLENRRLLAVGDLDPSFGNLGKYMPPELAQPPGYIVPTDFAVLEDGKILVTGNGVLNIASGFRLTADGNIDPTFGQGQIVVGAGHGGAFASANAIAIGPGGRFAVAGTNGPLGGAADSATVAGFKPDGSVDSAFGGHG